MELKDVYTALEKVENGAELITAIKAEINTLNNEAKKNRIAGEQNATKLKNVLEAVGLADSDDVVEKAKGMKANLPKAAKSLMRLQSRLPRLQNRLRLLLPSSQI